MLLTLLLLMLLQLHLQQLFRCCDCCCTQCFSSAGQKSRACCNESPALHAVASCCVRAVSWLFPSAAAFASFCFQEGLVPVLPAARPLALGMFAGGVHEQQQQQ